MQSHRANLPNWRSAVDGGNDSLTDWQACEQGVSEHVLLQQPVDFSIQVSRHPGVSGVPQRMYEYRL
jgi:hypothetical protein